MSEEPEPGTSGRVSSDELSGSEHQGELSLPDYKYHVACHGKAGETQHREKRNQELPRRTTIDVTEALSICL